jgi:hypothetical protein
MSNPNISYFKALNRNWKYLNNYPKLGTYYDYNKDIFKLLGYIDAN